MSECLGPIIVRARIPSSAPVLLPLDRSLLVSKEFMMFARPWLVRARKAGEDKKPQPFEGLIYLWVTFNAWLAQIAADRTKAEKDWYLVEAAARDVELQQKFNNLCRTDAAFEKDTTEFACLWPVFKVRALQEAGIPPWNKETKDRQSYCANSFDKLGNSMTHRDYAPSCYCDHQPSAADPWSYSSSNVPVDWPHTIDAIYKVRCNLFHGGKSFFYSSHELFVKLAFSLLWRMWGADQAEQYA